MGRSYTGADYTIRPPKLELSYLLKAGLFAPGKTMDAEIKWTTDERVIIKTVNTQDLRYMDLTSHHLDHNYEPRTASQRIYLRAVPSNLGRGEVLYFECPYLHRSCRVLYRAYHSETFRSRGAFHRPIFYPLQYQTRFTRHSQREIYAEAKLDRLLSMRATSTYKGKPTRRALRIAQLEREHARLCELGWHPSKMPYVLRKALEQGELFLGI